MVSPTSSLSRRLLEIEVATVEGWSSILRVATKLEFSSFRDLAIRELGNILPPVEQIALGNEMGITQWRFPAYVALCTRRTPPTKEEASHLGQEELFRVFTLREHIRALNMPSKEDIDKLISEELCIPAPSPTISPSPAPASTADCRVDTSEHSYTAPEEPRLPLSDSVNYMPEVDQPAELLEDRFDHNGPAERWSRGYLAEQNTEPSVPGAGQVVTYDTPDVINRAKETVAQGGVPSLVRDVTEANIDAVSNQACAWVNLSYDERGNLDVLLYAILAKGGQDPAFHSLGARLLAFLLKNASSKVIDGRYMGGSDITLRLRHWIYEGEYKVERAMRGSALLRAYLEKGIRIFIHRPKDEDEYNNDRRAATRMLFDYGETIIDYTTFCRNATGFMAELLRTGVISSSLALDGLKQIVFSLSSRSRGQTDMEERVAMFCGLMEILGPMLDFGPVRRERMDDFLFMIEDKVKEQTDNQVIHTMIQVNFQ